MITDYPCPICQADAWHPVQDFVYNTRDQISSVPKYRHYWHRMRRYFELLWFNAPYPRTVSVPPLNAAQRLRRQVLFDCWFPGEKSVTLTSVLCLKCGFMAYSPRPTQADLQAKYVSLSQKHSPCNAVIEQYDLKRAQRIYHVVTPHFLDSSTPLSILDYGGGDGRLMQPFLQRGDQCSLVDYASNIRPGIVKLGDELEAVPPDRVFDIIICSHVLEHLANPLDIVQQLRSRLKPDGVIYAEVPHEIWDGIRIEYDPITHVNFFTLHTLEYLFLRADYQILASRQIVGSYGKAHKEVIWLLAQQGNGMASDIPSPVISPESFLRPGRLRSLRRLWRQYVSIRGISNRNQETHS